MRKRRENGMESGVKSIATGKVRRRCISTGHSSYNHISTLFMSSSVYKYVHSMLNTFGILFNVLYKRNLHLEDKHVSQLLGIG